MSLGELFIGRWSEWMGDLWGGTILMIFRISVTGQVNSMNL